MENDKHTSDISIKTTDVGESSFSIGGINVPNTEYETRSHGNSVGIIENNNHVYRQDVVSRKDENIIGVVTEVAGDSDSESDITDDEEDDLDDEKEEEEDEAEGEGEEGGEEEERHKNEGSDGVGRGDENQSSDQNASGDNKRSSLVADQVWVLWMDDSETTHHRNELTVVDRGFLHGDYVASALDPTGQIGLVVDVNVSVDLRAPDGHVGKDISSRDLKRVREVTVGDYVVCGPWLGRVDDVEDNVTVLFDDGSMCKVNRADPSRLRPIAKKLIEDGHCPYYPGQRVSASSSIFKNARWLSGTWRANRSEGTVVKVTVGSVYVHWVASAGYGLESSTSPTEEQNPKNLKLLSCFTHANWQLGDWCLLPSLENSSKIPLNKGFSKLRLQESDSSHPECGADEFSPDESDRPIEAIDPDREHAPGVVDVNVHNNLSPKSGSGGSSISVSKDVTHESRHIHRKKLRKLVVKRDKKVRKKEENYDRALLIVNTRTKVDVLWQDGNVEHGIKSTLLIPIESPGDHDFVAEQYVVEKAADDSDETSEIRRVGVVKSVNAKEKTACVRWLKQVARPEDPREFEKEETASVYELEGHPDYDYCYGDVVVRLSTVSVIAEGACSGSTEGHNILDGSHDVKQEPRNDDDDKGENMFDREACNEFSNLSWVGNITGLRNGDIEVTWADGMISTVGPQAVYVVGRDDDESIGAGSEVSDDAASWETVEDDEMDSLNNEEKELPAEGRDTNHEAGEGIVIGDNNSGMNGPLSFPLAAIGFVTRLASGIFSRQQRNEDSVGSNSSGENDVQSEEELQVTYERAARYISNPPDPSLIDIASGDTTPGNSDMISENSVDAPEASCHLKLKEPDSAICADDNTCSFKRFDTAKDPLDHFFLGANVPSNSGRKWLKKVHRDWNILQSNLPDGIYVRVYENRMDLLRAVIVGAYGTPYQDGLFFFDFHLPPEYPDVPPSAHYHSGGWRINPNLYEEGKVCLSLLNTWTGRGNEVWDPQSSSILQVLVSLQGLVLNSKPYFNEAGYDKQKGTAEGEKNSLSYNENTFLLNCKTIMYLIRKPPKDFEDLVKEHFRYRGYYILKACDAYMKGYLIGSLARDASLTERSEANATSVGFKLMLTKIVPKLFTALSEVGADCHEFKHLQ